MSKGGWKQRDVSPCILTMYLTILSHSHVALALHEGHHEAHAVHHHADHAPGLELHLASATHLGDEE